MSWKKIVLLLGLEGFLAGGARAAHTLASQGRTPYAIVPPAEPTQVEQEAVNDLQAYLKEITGAEFTVDPGAPSPRIVVGRRAPGDKRPLAARERRVRSEGNDIYLYGEGAYGSAFAVYDFLERFLGCRWYSLWGDQRVPRKTELTLDALDYAIVPSFQTFEAGSRNFLMEKHPEIRNFFRRRRIFFMPSYTEGSPDCGWHYVGPPIHGTSAYVPPGGDPPGQFSGGWAGPHELFADKAYFETNPEFFTMDETGTRVPRKQLCFSNPELRQTFIENLEKVIAYEKYDPATPGVISLDVNDKGGPFCACPECQVLVDRYGAIGGPYYDFLLELSRVFMEKYPNLVIRFLAYGRTMTEIPPAFEAIGEPLPANLVPFFAPLYADFARALNHPINQASYTNFLNWSRVSQKMWLWMYPCTYPWPSWNAPLVAGGYRLAEDLRAAHALKVRMVMAEFGGSVIDNLGFKPLWIYLLSRLSNDISLDEQEVIREFMEGFYGRAAPLMLDYFHELEKLQLQEPHYLRYRPDPRILSYATPENLVRWQAGFDRMEDLVRDDPDRLLNVQCARLNLDALTVHRWPKIEARMPGIEFSVDDVYRRHVATLEADFDRMYSGAPDTPRMKRIRKYRFNAMKGGGIDRFYAEIQDPVQPLPEAFAQEHKGKIIHRIRPLLNRRGLRSTAKTPEPDEDGAFGVAVKGRTTEDRIVLQVWKNGTREMVPFDARVLRQEALESAPPGYRLYKLGRFELAPDCYLVLRLVDGMYALFEFGYLFDSERPGQTVDLYASVNYEPPGLYRCDQMVLVEARDGD